MMIYWGLSYGHHDASAVILKNSEVVFARKASEYTYVAFDRNLPSTLIEDMLKFGYPDNIFLHENKFRDFKRKLLSGDWLRLVTKSPKLPFKPISGNHHLSHAAAAFYTSSLKEALVIVADAIGEMESLAVYYAKNNVLNSVPLFTLKYPHSLGLFYSYYTAKIGFTPLKEENRMMKIATSNFTRQEEIYRYIDTDNLKFTSKKNFHYKPKELVYEEEQRVNIASTVQDILEKYLLSLFKQYSFITNCKALVFTGGVAYNKKVVQKLGSVASSIYVPSHPGDAGSSYGAILQHTNKKIILTHTKMFND